MKNSNKLWVYRCSRVSYVTHLYVAKSQKTVSYLGANKS